MFEALQGLEPLQGGQVERCPGARLRWVEKGVSLHHPSLQEMVEADHSVEEKSRILNRNVQLLFPYFPGMQQISAPPQMSKRSEISSPLH